MLEAQLGEALSQASIALILLDAREPEVLLPDTLDVARRVATSACVLHTKLDLVPCDYSEPHLRYLASKPLLSHQFDVDCLSVNLTTGEGVDDVLAFIGALSLACRGLGASHVPLQDTLSQEHLPLLARMVSFPLCGGSGPSCWTVLRRVLLCHFQGRRRT